MPSMKPTIREDWVDNQGVRLHYIESNPDTPPTLSPLVYIHGAYGMAEKFLPEMEALSPRRCIAISLRGRGKSDAPETGYSFDHHISDIKALVNHLGLGHFCLMGWSVGVGVEQSTGNSKTLHSEFGACCFLGLSLDSSERQGSSDNRHELPRNPATMSLDE